MVSRQKKYITWLVYLPMAFAIIYYNLTNYAFDGEYSLDFVLFLLLAIAVAIFPVRTNDSVFSLVTGVSLATFIVFGLGPEIFLSSIALLFALFRADIRWDQHHRYAINLLMIGLLSLISAIAYYGTSDLLTELNLSGFQILPMGVYMVVQILGNQLFIYIMNKYIFHAEDVSFFNELLAFSFQTSLVTFPLSFILVYLYSEMGIIGIVIGALPFLTISVGTKYYFKSRSYNMILTELNKHSQRLTANMDLESVLNAFSQSLLKLFPGNHVLFFNLENKHTMVLERIYGLNNKIEIVNEKFNLKEGTVLMDALDKNRISTYASADEWKSFISEEIDFEIESAVILPVHILSQNKGLLVFTHPHQGVYDEFLISLIEVFHQYFMVVVDNAFSFEQLEASSMTDYLTNLPNLRGFSQKVKTIIRNQKYESLSVIVIDLDYFKKINDEHGHEAGNDVLKQVSDVLKEFMNENLFVARYGGEEFVLFLTDFGRECAFETAEEIRGKIEETVYKPRYSIVDDDEAEITVTASLGVATYPDDCDDVYDLVNLADRIMYLESKKNGRNRVAEFVKES